MTSDIGGQQTPLQVTVKRRKLALFLNTSTGTTSMQDYAQVTISGGRLQGGQKNS
ncbi:hypothetical protein DPMN_158433 [Dreissena polymorpha]|uniref:Uncharacterized protein n=1 Tax=Dreissena polymorpha TaxID=45954 RepID=A0A9D4EJT8_DREPO|nr:hypothetical protein DPMN_158433 [Dreissena polymorpha]